MEQFKAFLTQIHLTMLAHILDLVDILIPAHSPYDSKAFFEKALLEAAKVAPSAVTCSYLFMESLWTV
jgi:hypothetical protein